MQILKITRVGDDVIQTTAEKDLLFTSENNTGKIFIDEKDTVANTATLNIPHGLAYIPFFMSFVLKSSRWFPVPRLFSTGITAEVDSTNVTIVNNDGGSRDFRTFVFIDPIA